MRLAGSRRWWAAYLTVALACTAAWLALDRRLAEQTGLRRQVWIANDFQGVPFRSDVSSGADLAFLDEDPRLPREFFSVRWQGYWYVPSSEFVILHVEADDYADIWIDGELRFERTTAAARGIRLDPGLHELRIDYQQYGGAANLSLLVRRGGAYPRPFRTDYLFPDVPESATLRLAAVIGRLPAIVALTWAASALALAVLARRRRRTPTARDAYPPARPPTRYDAAALTALCFAMLVHGYGNLSLRQPGFDSLENLTLGIRLAQEGVYQRSPGQLGDHRREPFGPSLIAAADLAAEALGRGAVPSACVSGFVSRAVPCQQVYVPYRSASLLLLLAGALGVFWLILRLTGVRVLAYLGFIMTAQSAALLENADSFLTEVHAATLMIAVAVLSLTTATTRRPLYAALLGLALAALVLTKALFAYLWIPIALVLVAADWRRRQLDWTTAGLVGLLFAAQALPVGGWMARNYLTSGDFSIVDARRSAAVLGLRASFHTMRHDEWAAGFANYSPLSGQDTLSESVPPESFERFDDASDKGFRQTGRRITTRRRAELLQAGDPALAGLDETRRRQRANDTIAGEYAARLLGEPVQHLKVALLLAWRGVFPEQGLGSLSDPVNRRLADIAGWNDWPRWRRAYGPYGATLVNLVGFLALIIAPLWLWLGRGRFEEMLIFTPAVYAHGLYAAGSHFIPRYAEPQIPLRVVATMVLLYLVWSSLRTAWARRTTITAI